MFLLYKSPTLQSFFKSKQKLIESEFISMNENQNESNFSFNSFQDFFNFFHDEKFIDTNCINNFLMLYVKYKGESIPKNILFGSTFTKSLIQSINELLQSNAKDREISHHLWGISVVASIGYCDLFAQETFILMLLHICKLHRIFYTTTLHTITCLNYLLNYKECVSVLIPQLDNFIILSREFTNVQARIRSFEFLTRLSVHNADEKTLINISKLLIDSLHFSNVSDSYETEGALNAINNFLPLSDFHLQTFEKVNFFNTIPEIVFQAGIFSNDSVLNLIQIISKTQFCFFLIHQKTINAIYRIICNATNKQLEKSYDILSYLITIDRNIIAFMKNTKIIDNAILFLEDSSFLVKKSVCKFISKLLLFGDLEVVTMILQRNGIDILIENDEMSEFENATEIIQSLSTCITLLDNHLDVIYLEDLKQKVINLIDVCN